MLFTDRKCTITLEKNISLIVDNKLTWPTVSLNNLQLLILSSGQSYGKVFSHSIKTDDTIENDFVILVPRMY